MRPALNAMIISTLAFIAGMIVGDMIISVITLAVSTVRLAHAAHQTRHPAQIYPHRFAWMR